MCPSRLVTGGGGRLVALNDQLAISLISSISLKVLQSAFFFFPAYSATDKSECVIKIYFDYI